MKLLLFLLGISFYFIFFLFSRRTDIEGNIFSSLFLEAHIYIVLSLIAVFSIMFPASGGNRQTEEMTEEIRVKKVGTFKIQSITALIKIFFSRYLYIVALLLFYTSLFLITQYFLGKISVSIILVVLNVVVLFLLFIEHKMKIFQDFLRINTIVVSLYYICIQVLYLFGYTVDFQVYDIINIVALWVLFFLSLYKNTKKVYMQGLQSYVIVFLFLQISVLSKYFFGNFTYIFGILSVSFSFLFLIFTQHLKKTFLVSLPLIRFWGVVFSLISIIFIIWGIFSNLVGISFFIPFLFLLSLFLYKFHIRFQNYICLFSSIIGVSMTLFFIYSKTFSEDFTTYISLFLLLLSWSILFFSISQRKVYFYDTYLFHTVSFIVNIIGVISFFFFQNVSILSVGIILGFESLYFFGSYYFFLKKTRGIPSVLNLNKKT